MTSSEIAASAVDTSEIAANAVNGSKIANGTITGADLSSTGSFAMEAVALEIGAGDPANSSVLYMNQWRWI